MMQKADQLGRSAATKKTVQRNKVKSAQAESELDQKTLSAAQQHPAGLNLGQQKTLQAKLGNQAVQRLIQPKMQVNAVGDKYEQEADAVAKEVVAKINGPQNSQQAQSLAQRQETDAEEEPIAKRIQRVEQMQRQETAEEDETLQMKRVQRQEMEEEDGLVQAKLLQTKAIQREVADEAEVMAMRYADVTMRQENEEERQMKEASQDYIQGGTVRADVESRIEQARGGGRPLDNNVKEHMEEAFGADFSGVRVHTNSEANELNEAVQAKAFTTGSDIFFRDGEHSPGSTAGKELLAHELTHVVQQSDKMNRKSNAPILLPEISIVGNPEFYETAKRSNQYYANHPPFSGWPYTEHLKNLWAQEKYDEFADQVRNHQEKKIGGGSKDADGILGLKTANKIQQLTSEGKDTNNSETSENDKIEYQPIRPRLLDPEVSNVVTEGVFTKITFNTTWRIEEAVSYLWPNGKNEYVDYQFRPYLGDPYKTDSGEFQQFLIHALPRYLKGMRRDIRRLITTSFPTLFEAIDLPSFIPNKMKLSIQEAISSSTLLISDVWGTSENLKGLYWLSRRGQSIHFEAVEFFDPQKIKNRRHREARKYINSQIANLVVEGKSITDAIHIVFLSESKILRLILEGYANIFSAFGGLGKAPINNLDQLTDIVSSYKDFYEIKYLKRPDPYLNQLK